MFRELPKTGDVESDDMEEYTPSIPDQVGQRRPHYPEGHIRWIWKIHRPNWKAVCCASTSVEDIGRMIEGVMRVFRHEVERPRGDERTRNLSHVILQLTSCL